MKYYLQSRTLWINLGFLVSALINAYCQAHGIEYEITGYQVMTALAIAGPLANKLMRFNTTQPITLKKDSEERPQS